MQSESITYSAKSAAVRAARKALGPEAIPGADFTLSAAGERWSWAPKASAPAPAASRLSAKHRAMLEAAQAGKLPPEPDFSAETHRRWRPKLAEVVAMAKAGDVEGLRAYPIKPISTSPKAIDRYRNLAVIALEAGATRH